MNARKKRGPWHTFANVLAAVLAEVGVILLLYLVALLQGKHLWALMELLIVPTALAGITILLNSALKKWELWKSRLRGTTTMIHGLVDLGLALGTVKFNVDNKDYTPESEAAILEAMAQIAKAILSPDIILVIREFPQFEPLIHDARDESSKTYETYRSIGSAISNGEWQQDKWVKELRKHGKVAFELAKRFNVVLAEIEDALTPDALR